MIVYTKHSKSANESVCKLSVFRPTWVCCMGFPLTYICWIALHFSSLQVCEEKLILMLSQPPCSKVVPPSFWVQTFLSVTIDMIFVFNLNMMSMIKFLISFLGCVRWKITAEGKCFAIADPLPPPNPLSPEVLHWFDTCLKLTWCVPGVLATLDLPCVIIVLGLFVDWSQQSKRQHEFPCPVSPLSLSLTWDCEDLAVRLIAYWPLSAIKPFCPVCPCPVLYKSIIVSVFTQNVCQMLCFSWKNSNFPPRQV